MAPAAFARVRLERRSALSPEVPRRALLEG
jgi:hypothetical protein